MLGFAGGGAGGGDGAAADPQRNQLRTIIDLPALADFFPIDRIERIAPDLWRVSAGRCHVDVRLVPRARTGRGLLPPRIEPVAGRRTCRR